jgi:hypothetical protein
MESSHSFAFGAFLFIIYFKIQGVWGLGFGVWGLGFGVWGLGFGLSE